MDEEKIIEQRKDKISKFLKSNYNWVFYLILAALVWLSIFIRTRNLTILKDITTNSWTLGPDLDPFLFLRWADHIVQNGSLMALDTFRYAPMGYNTALEVLLHPYLIAWFHNFISFLGLTSSIEYSAVIFPVVMFALTVVFFFLFIRKVFMHNMGSIYANIIASISSLFMIILPAILPRTIAGIPEKEASGFFFMFLSFYLFISAWDAKKFKNQIILSILSGAAMAGMAGVWGGYGFLFLTISISLIMALFLGQIDRNKTIIALLWLMSAFVLMNLMSDRYSYTILFNSTTTLIPLFVIIVGFANTFITKSKYFSNKISKYPKLEKMPSVLLTILYLVIIAIILFLIFAAIGITSFSFITDKVNDLTKPLIVPVTSRLGVTVAENKQPYFGEWADSFGPIVKGIPIFFWIFFFGSIYLYNHMFRVFSKRERIWLTLGYAFFIFAIIFSRYSASSVFNGVNNQSILFYILGVLVLIYSVGHFYYHSWKKGESDKLKDIEFGLIMIFSLFFFSLVSARSAIRLVMVLVLPSAAIAGYFVVAVFKEARESKDETKRLVYYGGFILLSVLLIYSANYNFNVSKATAQSYGPSVYTQQWQLAMSWVRENTPEDAVFGHWWDYGYWLQSIGKRATVLDGGNQYEYWDYLMGRHGLTTSNFGDALEFFYTHNTTHLLIDSTDIGKYPAFSSIGSNENYDRYSYMMPLIINKQQIQENKNSTIYLYQGGIPMDADLFYEDNGTKISLPEGKAGLGAVLIEKDKKGEIISPPIGIFVYQNKQYRIPLRYAFVNNTFKDFNKGIEAGVFVFTSVEQAQEGVRVEKDGVMLYLSNKTVKSLLVRLYLYKEDNPYFKLVHSEDDFAVASLKSQNAISQNDDIIYYQGVRGPIRIWGIVYPDNVKSNPEYLKLNYPNTNLSISTR